MKAPLWVALGLGLASLLLLANLAGLLPVRHGLLYEDPAGRFSLRIPREVQLIEQGEDHVHWAVGTPPVEIYVDVLHTASLTEGIETTFRNVGQDPGLLTIAGSGSLGSWTIQQYAASEGSTATLAAQVRGECCYVLMALGDSALLTPAPPMSLMQMFESFRFTGAAGKPWRPSSFLEFEAAVDRAAMENGGSISIAAFKNDGIAYTYTTGYSDPLNGVPADTMTTYPWFSITKIATATAVMQLVESGQVGLDDPISEFVPEYSSLSVSTRQLLSHSSGLPDRSVYHLIELPGESCLDIRGVSEAYAASFQELAYVPGTRWCYNNYDYLVLGRLVEEVSGLGYATYVAKNILEPLGMIDTGFQYAGALLEHAAYPVLSRVHTDEFVNLLSEGAPCGDPTRFIRISEGNWTYLRCFEILAPWAGLIGTVTDAAAFVAAHLHGGIWNGVRILTPDSVRAMQAMQTTPTGELLGFGLGWVIPNAEDEPIVEHAGGAGAGESMVRLYPERDLGIIVMGNMSGYHPGTLITYLAELLPE